MQKSAFFSPSWEELKHDWYRPWLGHQQFLFYQLKPLRTAAWSPKDHWPGTRAATPDSPWGGAEDQYMQICLHATCLLVRMLFTMLTCMHPNVLTCMTLRRDWIPWREGGRRGQCLALHLPIWRYWFRITHYVYNGNRPSNSYSKTKMVQSDVNVSWLARWLLLCDL